MLEEPGPVHFDLGSGQTLPFTGVTLHQVRFCQNRPDTEVLDDDGCRLSRPL